MLLYSRFVHGILKGTLVSIKPVVSVRFTTSSPCFAAFQILPPNTSEFRVQFWDKNSSPESPNPRPWIQQPGPGPVISESNPLNTTPCSHKLKILSRTQRLGLKHGHSGSVTHLRSASMLYLRPVDLRFQDPGFRFLYETLNLMVLRFKVEANMDVNNPFKK